MEFTIKVDAIRYVDPKMCKHSSLRDCAGLILWYIAVMKTRLILCMFLFLGACQKDYSTEISFSKEPKEFSTQIELSQSSLPLVEDLDQDGNADVVFFGKGFQIFWGKKDQTLEESPVFAQDVYIGKIFTIKSPNTKTRDLVFVGSSNEDGIVNMYLAPIEKTRTEPMLKKIITLPTESCRAVVDYNRDGKDDLLCQDYRSSHNNYIGIMLGTETRGVFTRKTIPLTGEYTADYQFSFYNFSELYDVNKDGHPDLLYYSSDEGIKDPILIGMWQPNDTFQVQPAQIKTDFFRNGGKLMRVSSLSPFTGLFVIARYDDDASWSDIDLNESVSVQVVSIGTMGQVEKVSKPSRSAEVCGYAANYALLSDLNKNGQEDVLFVRIVPSTSTIRVHWLTDVIRLHDVNALDCNPSKSMQVSDWDYYKQIALGDLDGNGYPEIILANGKRTFSVFYNQGPEQLWIPKSGGTQ